MTILVCLRFDQGHLTETLLPGKAAPSVQEQNFHHFTVEDREIILQEIQDLLAADPRISGALLVGSGARGFADRCSDIDLTVAVTREGDVKPVLDQFAAAFRDTRDVLSSFSGQPEPEVHLFGAFLACLIEVDISFLHCDRMVARTMDWRILFDRSGRLKEQMTASWANHQEPDRAEKLTWHLGEIWYFVIHAANSLARGRLWQASYHIAEVRHRAFQLSGLRCALPMGYLKSADECPPGFLKEMETTLFDRLEKTALFDALEAATRSFFDQAESLAREIEAKAPIRLRKALLSHINQMRRFNVGD